MVRQGPGRAHELASLAYANRRLVEALGRRLGIHEGDLPDLMQRVVVTLFRRSEAVHRGCEHGFLSRVTRREARHMLRSYRRRAEVCEDAIPQLGAHSQAEEYVHRQRELRRLRLLFAGVPEPMRDVWLRHVIDGTPCHEVATVMNLPLGTVKSRLRRVWKKVLDRSVLGDVELAANRQSHTRDGTNDALPGIG
jgi:RNA polymerase sigma-70 factor (ECF subfamily)